MFCSNCGVKALKNSNFCNSCGQNLGSVTGDNPTPSTIGVQDQQLSGLWKPTTASSLSLLLTPAFGAYVHAQNWKTLGSTEESKQSMIWFYSTILLLILIIVFRTDSNTQLLKWLYIGNLLAWYFVSAKGQQKYFKKENIQTSRSLLKPVLVFLPLVLIYAGILFGVKVPITMNLKDVRCDSQFAKNNVKNVIENSNAVNFVKLNLLDMSEMKELSRSENQIECGAKITTNTGPTSIRYKFTPSSDKKDIIVEVKEGYY